MKKTLLITLAVTALNFSRAEDPIDITHEHVGFGQKPIPVALSGFTGEGLDVLKFDLYVQGFSFVTPDQAKFVISGSDSGNITGSVTDKLNSKMILSRSYNGASLRRQAHAFADEIVLAIQNKKGIGQTKISYDNQPAGYGPGEIYVADFDGHGAQAITSNHAIVGKSSWVPGKLALYYMSFAHGNNPDIFYQDLTTGDHRVVAGYSGSNISPAVSPNGTKVAMILSKSGSPNVWVCNADGSNLKRLTTGIEDSAPCWSPDGQWICFAMKTKEGEKRRLAKVSASGGEVHVISTSGVLNPTEPDWSPDGKWIAFTSQMGDFNICVMPADGSAAPVTLVAGQSPSWSPNSRTLAFHRGPDSRSTLSVLDVFTKQYKDCARAGGSNSQPSWAK